MKRCNESFTIWRGGAPVAFVAGQLVDDKHPILKTHGHMFSEPQTAATGPFVLRPAEQATADPGGARTLTPPQQTAREGDRHEAEPFDPVVHVAKDVLAYLAEVGEEEAIRVLDLEAAGENRKGIAAQRDSILEGARARDAERAEETSRGGGRGEGIETR